MFEESVRTTYTLDDDWEGHVCTSPDGGKYHFKMCPDCGWWEMGSVHGLTHLHFISYMNCQCQLEEI